MSASAKVSLDVHVGFGNSFRLAHWTPVSVVVSNAGRSFSGHLEISTTAGNALDLRQFQTTYSRPLEMPAGARRLVRLTVLIDSLAHPLRVRVRQNELSLASAELPLKRRFTDLQMVAVLSPEVSLDALNQRGVRVTYTLLVHLPEHWRGYDGLKALVVHGTSLESLTARQYGALKKWLASGGTLVVSGRADYTLMRTRRLRDLLPAEPDGLLKVSSRELFPDADSHQQIHLHRVKTPSSRVTRRLDGAPLVVSGPEGAGAVHYFTFDIAAERVQSAALAWSIWEETLGLQALARAAQTSPSTLPQREFVAEDNPADAILSANPYAFPTLVAVLLFLGMYLLALAITVNMREGASGQLGHRLSVLLPLVFAPAAWWLFAAQFPAGTTAISVSSLTPIVDSHWSRVETDVIAFTTARQRLDYALRGAEPVWEPLLPGNDRYIPPSWRFGAAPDISLSSGDAQPYVMHALHGSDLAEFDIAVDLVSTDGVLSGRLVNHSDLPIAGAWLVIGDTVFPVGPVAARAESRHDRIAADADNRMNSDAWYRRLTSAGRAPEVARFEAALAERVLTERLLPAALQAANARLFAIVRSPMRTTPRALPARGLTFAYAHLPIDLSYRETVPSDPVLGRAAEDAAPRDAEATE